MSHFALNLVLAIVWTFLTGSFTVRSFLFGFIAGFTVLALSRPFIGGGNYTRSVVGTSRLIGYFLFALVVANLQLARDILRPVPRFVPGFIRYDVGRLSPVQTVLLGNLISLTPGTLTVDFDGERGMIYIHAMYATQAQRDEVDRFARLVRAAAGGDTSDWRAGEEEGGAS